jgi:hypothetical protein
VTGSTPKEFILNLKSRQTSWVKELLVILVYIS